MIKNLKIKKTLLTIFTIVILSSFYSSKAFGFDWDSFLENLYHWNLTLQRNIYGDTYIYNDSLNTSFTVIDEYGDDYTFHINQNANHTKTSYLPLTLRIPLFYNDNLSIGLSSSQRYFYTKIFEETGSITHDYDYDNLMGVAVGVYLSVKVLPRLWIFTTLGGAYYYLNTTADTLKPSWYEDPGLYWDGYFYKPGTPLKVRGETDYKFFFSIGMKYYIYSGIFLELNYYYLPGATINNMSYILEGPVDLKINVSPEKLPKPITIEESHVFTLGIGIGL
ncbi:MAG: hypothetical protein N2Z64_06280 [Dictyoglomus thermophilum]|nr:hypothetical protein [Dictyoglomus thermophilum]MCX7720878.1 hypothetical protein [Dictyoglomus thermophilum]